MKLSPRSFALLAAGFLLGSLLAPVAAQQVAPRDGQVAVRSDGAVYVISNGQKRWVATIIITDDELNAIPEAEPIYTGLAPMGSSGSSSSSAATPKPTEQPKATPTSTPQPSSSSSSSDDNDNDSSSGNLLIEEVTYDEDVKQGEDWHISAVVNREKKGRCELKIEYNDNEEQDDIDDETPDSDGVCEFTVDVPRDAATGNATWTLTVTDGDDETEDSDRFEVKRR
jgi:hypothetical protein